MSKSEKHKKENSELKWFIIVFITTFILSIIFSYISTNAISYLELLPAILILILTIFVGIIFDIIGVAVTVAKEEEMHAKASKKIQGAKTSIKLIRNSSKVSNICADVIGDICGVLSGAISAMIAVKITNMLNVQVNTDFLISAVVAAVTVGSKAAGKVIAQEHSTSIVHIVGRILNFKQ